MAILINWGERLSVNVKEMDTQHKKLIDIINQLNDAMLKGQGRNVAGGILAELLNYTSYHFAAEEKYLEKYNYPDIISHKKKHAALIQKVREFKSQYDEGAANLSIQLMQFLNEWLVHHIMGTDKQYAAFLNEKGLR